MKLMLTRLVCLIELLTITFMLTPMSQADSTSQQKQTPEIKKTYDDIKKTLGFVPQFLRFYPESALPGAWEEFKGLQLNPKTALSAKDKELIGLGVAAQIPCDYCTYYHTKAVHMNGGSDLETREAIAVSGSARHWSTWLNGLQIDEPAFRNDIKRIYSYMSQNQTETTVINTPEDVYKDARKMTGSVPAFLRAFPREAVVGAWKDLKELGRSSNTALKNKEKALISLAVSAQTPCHNCVVADTENAKLNGANDLEINEALAMSAMTRRWSTVVAGSQIDVSALEREADNILDFVIHRVTAPQKIASVQTEGES